MVFRTQDGIVVPAATAEQMREVDRIAVEGFDLGILQMMENAGRNLALNHPSGTFTIWWRSRTNNVRVWPR